MPRLGRPGRVYLDGEAGVDIWGGYADAARTAPWERECAAAGKGGALVRHVLAHTAGL